MGTIAAVLAIIAIAYVALITWAVFGRGEFAIVYDSTWGWILGHLAPHEECITIGARCYVYASTDLAVMTPQRKDHERFHYEEQWRKYPLTFIPRYYLQLIRYGYQCAPMEEDARKAAGEPMRCQPV